VAIAIGHAQDTAQARFAQARNTTIQAQTQLRDGLRTQIEEILHHAGMTQADYEHKTFLISTNADARKTFDELVAQMTGVPTPGQLAAAPERPIPAGAVGVHIGHVIKAFNGTPDGAGLLPVAMEEAAVAAQHAQLAARNTASLDAMKLHAGHVLNALDPTLMPMGPGKGYGLKKAAQGVVTHIELAAKTEGASANVVTHANHIATSTRNTLKRTDQIIALAQQVEAATSADVAAKAINEMASLAAQLIPGADANGDGRIGWQEGEGGLQQADEHVTLMLAGEMK
jgi:hypothetical protein